MTIQTADFDIRRGNNTPLAWQFVDGAGVIFPLDGSTFVLLVVWAGGSIRKETGVDDELVVDEGAGTLTWTPTVEETRLIPLRKIAKYEIERRAGSVQATWVQGRLTGKAGLNDD